MATGAAKLAALAAGAALIISGSVAHAQDGPLPPYRPVAVSCELNSVGDGSMAPLMDALFTAYQKAQPGVRKGSRWDHQRAERAMPALMFELADMAPLAREPRPAEVAPYAHQFAGDMMKAPLLVRIGRGADGGEPAVAVNKRPDSPLPPCVREFLAFALSREGQALVAAGGRFGALTAAEAAREREKLQGYLPGLDPTLPVYAPEIAVSGEIASVGSDGMKSLMERWMRDFQRVQPGVRKGERWEHLGTLNGFHALIADETMLAPMGRELWPEEADAYASTHGGRRLLEIRVARGGFNTPQRTTAQAIFVHQSNPLSRITLGQVAAIFGEPAGITRWGQLGLSGEWKDRPITVYAPRLTAPNAMSVQMRVLNGGRWKASIHEGTIAETAAAAASDHGSIAFGGFEEGGPGIKPLAVAEGADGPFYEGTSATVSGGQYPLARYMFIRLEADDKHLTPAVREFLRFVLSRDGQEPVRYSGYFPLSNREVQEELRKLR